MPTIAVVDDDPAVLRAVRALLDVSGYRAKIFHSPNAILAQQHLPQEGCLIIDLTAPGVDGPLFMHQLRARGCTIPVIMGSLWLDATEVQRWLQLGIFAVLDKPFDPTDFLLAVHQALNLSTYALMCGSLIALQASI